ncbi:hypothetical protein [Rhodococcus koreensis]|uniref:hypothetical protein n=1 Tax=Rhodococcus koreensis TaxID=99653 RepID=UPI00366DB7F1
MPGRRDMQGADLGGVLVVDEGAGNLGGRGGLVAVGLRVGGADGGGVLPGFDLLAGIDSARSAGRGQKLVVKCCSE